MLYNLQIVKNKSIFWTHTWNSWISL